MTSWEEVYKNLEGRLCSIYNRLDTLSWEDTEVVHVRHFPLIFKKQIRYFVRHYERKMFRAMSKICLSGVAKVMPLASEYSIVDIDEELSFTFDFDNFSVYDVINLENDVKFDSIVNGDINKSFLFRIDTQVDALVRSMSDDLVINSITMYKLLIPIGIGFYDEFRERCGRAIKKPIPDKYKNISDVVYTKFSKMLKMRKTVVDKIGEIIHEYI